MTQELTFGNTYADYEISIYEIKFLEEHCKTAEGKVEYPFKFNKNQQFENLSKDKELSKKILEQIKDGLIAEGKVLKIEFDEIAKRKKNNEEILVDKFSTTSLRMYHNALMKAT